MEFVQSDRLWAKFLETNGYRLVGCVGQGSFGDVYSVTCLDTGRAWAVKRLVARRNIEEDSYAMAEISALATIKHPTVVTLREVLLCPRVACIVMELAPAGNLEMLVLRDWGGEACPAAYTRLSDSACAVAKFDCCGLDMDEQCRGTEKTGKAHFSPNTSDSVEGDMEFLFDDSCLTGNEDRSFSYSDVQEVPTACFPPTPPSSPTMFPPPSSPVFPYPIGSTFLSTGFRQMLSALAFIHDLDLAHRDVNPSNILIVRDDLVKLADFGLCFRCRSNQHNGATDSEVLCADYLGRDQYLAPEVRRRQPFSAKPADVWSLGCVLYFMLKAAHPPVDSDELTEASPEEISRILPAVYGRDLKEKCLLTLGWTCRVKVSERKSIKDIQTHWGT